MRVIGRLVACLVVAVAAASRLGAQEDFRPNDRPSLEVRRAAGRIVVDGHLSDSGWVNAAKAFDYLIRK